MLRVYCEKIPFTTLSGSLLGTSWSRYRSHKVDLGVFSIVKHQDLHKGTLHSSFLRLCGHMGGYYLPYDLMFVCTIIYSLSLSLSLLCWFSSFSLVVKKIDLPETMIKNDRSVVFDIFTEISALERIQDWKEVLLLPTMTVFEIPFAVICLWYHAVHCPPFKDVSTVFPLKTVEVMESR